MNTIQTIQCPNAECHGTIQFDPYLLIQGKSFTCSTCNSVISLNQDSTEVVKDTLDKFDELKSQSTR